MSTPEPAPQSAEVEALVTRYLPGLRAFVRLHMGPLLRQREESCDLAQSVAREILTHADRFQHGGEPGFREWLYATARRKILNRIEHWSTAKRNAPAVSADEAVLEYYRGCYTPSQQAVAGEQLDAIERAFDRLTADQKEVLIQSRLIGRSHAEIAARMGKSQEAVRTILSRAVARLSLILAAE